MSTYWRLECVSHDPPIVSDDEVSQHTDFRLDFVRRVWANRVALLTFERTLADHDLGDYTPGFGDHMAAAAWWFIRRHPDCDVQLRSEYGDVQPISAGATAGAA